MSIQESTKSDELFNLRDLFSESGVFSQFGSLFQVNIILDANAILSDIRWVVFKAKQENARTSLLEAIDAGTILAFAPTYIEVEVSQHIHTISEQTGVPVEKLQDEWLRYREKITFIDSGGPENHDIDPKDVPYLKLHHSTGYPILGTNDPHLSKMGATVITVEVTTLAKKYSRDAVVEYKIKAGGLAVFTVSAAMIQAAISFLKEICKPLKSVPSWAWLMVICLVVFALSFSPVREFVKEKILSLSGGSKNFALNLIETLEPLVKEHNASKKRANEVKSLLADKVNV